MRALLLYIRVENVGLCASIVFLSAIYRCLMVMAKLPRFSSFVFAIVFLLIASRSDAQWSLMKAMPSQVRCVYFLDQLGAPTTGFVGGTNGDIMRTTDNGASWTAMTTPAPGYQVTQFTFKNTTQGWCSVRAATGGVWTTIDGGLNWTNVASIPAPGQMVSIGYNPASGDLAVVNWSGTAYQSFNLGTTWSAYAPTQQDGVTFSGMNGVTSNLATPNFKYTNDGGVTWNPVAKTPPECWSPYGIPGSPTFFAVAEHLGMFFRSADGGATWTNTYNFASTILPSGCVMGTSAVLFIQTSTNGFFYSLDQGNTWFPICGPSNNFDTRFYSVGKQIFAGDILGNLWYNPDGTASSTSTVLLDHKTFSYSGARCQTYDSVLHITYGSACSGAYLTKAQILFGGAAFSIENLSLPQYVAGKDSIQIIYSPTLAAKDTGEILLEFNTGSKIFDTLISLSGVGHSSISFNHDASIAMTTPYACFEKDSALVIRNLSCDTLTVTSALLSDTTYFHILPPGLPRRIAPGDSMTIPILTDVQHDGNYNSMLRLHMIGGTSVQVNDSIPLSLNVRQGAQPSFNSLQVALLNRCVSLDTTILIKNSQCDSIILVRALLSDTSVFHLGPLSLSHTIHASESFPIYVHIASQPKGSYTTQLQLRYLSGQRLVDTSITLSVNVLYDIPLSAYLSDTELDMGAVNVPCSATSKTFTIANPACRSISIDSIVWDPADSQYWLDPMSFPIALGTDSATNGHSFLVHFKPGSTRPSSAALKVTLDLDGQQVDTMIYVTGMGVSTFRDTLLTPILQFDTILACQNQELEGTLVNLSCDSMIAVEALLGGGEGFTAISPKFPQTVQPGDTLHVRFQLKPGITGQVQDSAKVVVRNPLDGLNYIKTIALSGFVIPEVKGVTMTASTLSLSGMAPCSSADSGLWIKNLGNCEEVIIDSANIAGYAGVVLTPPLALPITIHPGDSIHVAFHITPDNESKQQSLLAIKGVNIDTTYSFSYGITGTAHVMEFIDNGGTFITRPCTPVTKTFVINSKGCGTLTIDNLSISGPANQTQFTIQSPRTVPFTMQPGETDTITVIYQPDGTGNNGANLFVSSTQGNFSKLITLSGTAPSTGVPTARISMAASDMTKAITAPARGAASIVIHSLDGIGDSVSFSTVSFEVQYNQNLLTKVAVVVPAGWSVLDSTEHPGGILSVKLQHDAGGAVVANTLLATCYFAVSVGDSTECTIVVANLKFNDGDPNYGRCLLQSILLADTVHFAFVDGCATGTYRDMIDDRLQITNIAIRPNPIPMSDGAAHADMTFSLDNASDMTVVVRDMLGREITRASNSYDKGTHTLHLVLPNAAEGTYFAEIASGRARVVRKVMVEGR